MQHLGRRPPSRRLLRSAGRRRIRLLAPGECQPKLQSLPHSSILIATTPVFCKNRYIERIRRHRDHSRFVRLVCGRSRETHFLNKHQDHQLRQKRRPRNHELHGMGRTLCFSGMAVAISAATLNHLPPAHITKQLRSHRVDRQGDCFGDGPRTSGRNESRSRRRSS